MSTPFIIFIIVAVILLDIVFFAVIFGKYKSNRDTHMQKLAERFGLQMRGGEPLFPKISILKNLRKPVHVEGDCRGRYLKIYHYTVGSGKNSTTYAASLITGPNPKNLTFQFYREGFFSKLGKVVGLQDVPIGDPKFDKLFIVKSSDPAFITAALLPEIKEKFYTTWEIHKAKGTIELKEEELVYKEVGTIRNDDIRQRFEAVTDLLGDLADAVEVYNQQEI